MNKSTTGTTEVRNKALAAMGCKPISALTDAAKAVLDMVSRIGGDVGDMALRNEAEICGWEWDDIEDAVGVLLDSRLLVPTMGYDAVGRGEAAVRLAKGA